MEGKRKKKEKIHSFIGNATHQNLYSKSRGSNRPTLPCNHVRIEKQGQQSHVFPIKRRLSAPSSSFFSLSDTNLAASTNAKQHLEMVSLRFLSSFIFCCFHDNVIELIKYLLFSVGIALYLFSLSFPCETVFFYSFFPSIIIINTNSWDGIRDWSHCMLSFPASNLICLCWSH